jgi:hypothetical protein
MLATGEELYTSGSPDNEDNSDALMEYAKSRIQEEASENALEIS